MSHWACEPGCATNRLNAWHTDKSGTRHCKKCGASAFTVDAGCKCPDDPAEPPGSQFGSESTRIDSGSAGSVPVIEWAADEYRLKLVESDMALEKTSARAISIEGMHLDLVAEIRASKDEFVFVTKDGDTHPDLVGYFGTLLKAHANLTASNKNTNATQGEGRKVRSDLYRTAEVRESRQEAEMNKDTAVELKKLRGRH